MLQKVFVLFDLYYVCMNLHSWFKEGEMRSLCFEWWVWKLIIFVSWFSWWIKKLWLQLIWEIMWWWEIGGGPTNYKEWKVAQGESSFSFWIKLSTFMNLVLSLRTCFCFHDDVWIFYAPIRRILVVYIMVSQFSLCWRIKVLIKILKWVAMNMRRNWKVLEQSWIGNYLKRDGAWNVYLWGMSFVVGWEGKPLWALRHENYDWSWSG